MKKKQIETVDLIASGYEWECPKCCHLNKEIEALHFVQCRNKNCLAKYETEPPEHAYE